MGEKNIGKGTTACRNVIIHRLCTTARNLPLLQVRDVMMAIKIEESLVDRYHRDGAVLVEGVFEDALLEKVRRGIARNVARPSQYSQRLTVSGDWTP